MEWKDFTEQYKVAAILRNSILNERVAHAYIFAGSQGVGKKKLAIQFAKFLLCQQSQGEPCHSCHHCHRIDFGEPS